VVQRLFDIISRRYFCYLIIGFGVHAAMAKTPFAGNQSSKMRVEDPEFLIINGWVLSRQDITAGPSPNVV
jgi:hypothetical protein